MENSRRSFIRKAVTSGVGVAGIAVGGRMMASPVEQSVAQQKKKPSARHEGKLRFGFIGTGSRCQEHINNVLAIEGNSIVAVCDTQQGPLQRTRL